MKEISLEATLENVKCATEFIEEQLDKIDCPARAKIQINIAVDELFSNIARYAYAPDTGATTVRFETEPSPAAIIISFIDGGVPFDPTKCPDPDTTLPKADRSIGGLGIFLVKKSMDEVAYEYKNGKNILRIRKNI